MGILLITLLIFGYILIILISIYGINVGYQILIKRNYQSSTLILKIFKFTNNIILGKDRSEIREKELSSKKSIIILGIIAIISSPLALWVSIDYLIQFIKVLSTP